MSSIKPWIAEYVWVSGRNTYTDLRSKYKTMTNVRFEDATVDQMPEWNFDGSSTNQNNDKGHNTEIIIKPVAIYPHPDLENAKAVLCECYHPDGQPCKTNTRRIANEIFTRHAEDEVMFGLEQEYFIYKNGKPFMWPENGVPAAQGDYYCGNGSQILGRDIVLEHYTACLRMGLKISGVNAEVAPSQWEFQVGPCIGIEEGDHMIMARWVYQKVAEKYGLDINYDPKPVKGDWNGSGCHINISTKKMREDGGLEVIKQSCRNLEKTYLDDVKFYGRDNDCRMSGRHETSKLSEFTWGVGTRHTSVRIGNDIALKGKGYFEDRRPAANIDPYISSARLFTSCMGYEGPSVETLGEPEPWWTALDAEAAARQSN